MPLSKNFLSVSIRRLYRDYLRTTFYILIIASLLVSISIIIPLNATINLSIEKFSNLTSTVIKVNRNIHFLDRVMLGDPNSFNESLSRVITNKTLCFSIDDIIRIEGINHVKKIVKGIRFEVGWRPNTEKWREYEKKLAEEIGLHGHSVKIYYQIGVLGVEVDKAGDIVADFKNILEGRFIRPGSNEIILSKATIDYTGVKIGDYITIPIGDPPRNYTFHVTGVLLTPRPPVELGAVVDLNYMLKILNEVYGDVVNKYIAKRSFPLYHILYIKVDSIKSLYDVGNEIMKLYPEAGVEYNIVSASILTSTLNSFRNIYNIVSTALFIPFASTLFIARALETIRSRREIGLLKAVGWRNRHIITYIIIQTIIIGLLGGLVSTLAIIFLAPYIRGLFAINPTGLGLSGEAKAEAYAVLSIILHNIPDIRFTLLAPIYGIAIFILASIFTTIYYLRLEPSTALKEV